MKPIDLLGHTILVEPSEPEPFGVPCNVAMDLTTEGSIQSSNRNGENVENLYSIDVFVDLAGSKFYRLTFHQTGEIAESSEITELLRYLVSDYGYYLRKKG